MNVDQQVAAIREKWSEMPPPVLDQIETYIRDGLMTFDAEKDVLRITNAGIAHGLTVMRGKPT